MPTFYSMSHHSPNRIHRQHHAHALVRETTRAPYDIRVQQHSWRQTTVHENLKPKNAISNSPMFLVEVRLKHILEIVIITLK